MAAPSGTLPAKNEIAAPVNQTLTSEKCPVALFGQVRRRNPRVTSVGSAFSVRPHESQPVNVVLKPISSHGVYSSS